MNIDILTIFPDVFTSPFQHSIIKRAIDKGLVNIGLHDLRKYTNDKHKKVDDYAFGGTSGMVMTIQPIASCIDHLKSQTVYDEIIYLTPDGETLNQEIANQLSLKKNIAILCGHYKGVDQRVRDNYITREISIGDYVLSGGEYAAIILCDSIIRLIPGVISDETSALSDSFQDGILAAPVYTRPANYNGWEVPAILLSGHEANIQKWLYEKALERTQKRRPDLYLKL